MIRINLMGVDRGRTKPRLGIELSQKVTLACSAIFVAGVVIVAWQWLALRTEMAGLDDQLLSVDEELVLMSDVVDRRNEFETQSIELARRVALIGGPIRVCTKGIQNRWEGENGNVGFTCTRRATRPAWSYEAARFFGGPPFMPTTATASPLAGGLRSRDYRGCVRR